MCAVAQHAHLRIDRIEEEHGAEIDGLSPREAEILFPFGSSYEFFDTMGVTGLANGHGYMGGASSIHTAYSEIPGYWEAMVDRYGHNALSDHYRAFETICSATQDRQDAITTLLNTQQFDLAIVIGGYNSSNTRNLARICADSLPCFHIADADCLVSENEIRHRPAHKSNQGGLDDSSEVTSRDWLPIAGTVSVAVTAGASTPDSIVGDAISRLSTFANS